MPAVSEVELIRDLTRRSYADFVKEFWHTITKEPLKWNWHMDLLCSDLQKGAVRVAQRKPKVADRVYNISPGSSKSSICSILFPAWVWTFMPEAQFICGSHGEDLAVDLAGKSRDVVTSELYRACFPEIQLRADQNAKSNFKNTFGGYRKAIGSGGNVIGFHGHFIIIDDPIDPTKAVSEAELKAINLWLKETLRGRKVDKTVTLTILVMQRLHQNDPTAQMLKAPKVRHYRIPAELSYKVHPPELAEKYVDGLMDPVRLPRQVLIEERSPAGLGEYGYAGQYGQDPVPSGGGKFKTDKLRRGRPPAEFVSLVRYWDKAGTAGGGAYTVGVKGGVDKDGRLWVLDVVRVQSDSYEREKLIRRTAKRDGRGVIVGIEQEPGSGGKESAEGTVRRLMGFRCRLYQPRGDKELRAEEFSVQVNGGNVYLPEDQHDGSTWVGWAAEYVDELKHFPFSTYKDQTDASSGMMSVAMKGRRKVGGMRRRRHTIDKDDFNLAG